MCPYFILIAIAIGIGVDSGLALAVGHASFPHLIPSPTKSAEHGRHAVEFRLAVTALGFIQGIANNEDTLDCRALQRRPTRDLEVPTPARMPSRSR